MKEKKALRNKLNMADLRGFTEHELALVYAGQIKNNKLFKAAYYDSKYYDKKYYDSKYYDSKYYDAKYYERGSGYSDDDKSPHYRDSGYSDSGC